MCVAAKHLYCQSVDAFDSEADVEAYIRTLPVNSAFFAPGVFTQNFLNVQAPRPVPGDEGTYAIASFISANVPLPLIDAVHDGGQYVGAILANPDRYAGEILCAATGLYSYRDCAEIIPRITGLKTIYTQVPREQVVSHLPPSAAEPLMAMWRFVQSPGYFGPQTQQVVGWTVQQARGTLTPFEEFVQKHANDVLAQ